MCFPNEQHIDGFLVNFTENQKMINFQINAHTGRWEKYEEIASTVFEPFYLDNYNELKSKSYTNIENYNLTLKQFNKEDKVLNCLISKSKDGTKTDLAKEGMKISSNSKWWEQL